MLVDTHCHIHEPYTLPLDEVLARAQEAEVADFICVGTSEESSKQAIAFAEAHDSYAAVGVHPHDTKDGYDAINSLAGSSVKVIAVGEVGLDYFYTHSPKEVQIVKDAGITLYEEDIATISQSNDIVANGAGIQLRIDRATVVNLDLFGTKTEVRTQGQTVGDFLKEKDISLGTDDRVSTALSAPISSGLEIRIWREGVQTISVDEDVAFSVEQERDADRPTGYKEVKTAGVNGKRTVTYEIVIENGVEVGRTEIASIVLTPAVAQVEVIGTKVQLNVNYSADRAAIMTAAGIAASDQDYAAYIINNENGLWCPIRWQGTRGCADTYYEKFPGAEGSDQVGYGLCQATPGNKMATAGADWRTNAVTQMKWCHSYAISRYGSWAAAYQAKVAKGWW